MAVFPVVALKRQTNYKQTAWTECAAAHPRVVLLQVPPLRVLAVRRVYCRGAAALCRRRYAQPPAPDTHPLLPELTHAPHVGEANVFYILIAIHNDMLKNYYTKRATGSRLDARVLKQLLQVSNIHTHTPTHTHTCTYSHNTWLCCCRSGWGRCLRMRRSCKLRLSMFVWGGSSPSSHTCPSSPVCA